MKKTIIILFTTIITLSCLTGCFKRDKMEDINIATTIYPIEYVTNRLYGNNSKIKSIYPRDSISTTYEITEKQLKDYSEYDLFIYNGESEEREYATTMLNNNKNLKIIDAAYGLDATYSMSDIWLNPSNILMLGQNIKNELTEYISYRYLVEEIKDQYTLLKVDITELETEIKKTADNSVNNQIIVADESLNFLEKYGFEVINLTNNNKEKESNISKARELLDNGELNYIFVMDHSKDYDIVNELKDSYNVEVLTFRTLDTITEKDEQNNDDYLSIMHSNVDLIKQETYK
ncbi:MAG: metal ABC transporter substrate-binding protein [Bacilli bacterium]